MIRLFALAALFGTIGLSLLLSRAPWFRQPTLAARLRAHTPGLSERRPKVLGAHSFRDALSPAAEQFGGALARAVGVNEDLGLRLQRLHSEQTPAHFRLEQARHALLALLAASVGVTIAGLPVLVGGLALFCLPALTVLIDEHLLSVRSARWKQELTTELPLVEEQLAMLLDAGWSLGGALQHVCERSDGPAARDLARVLIGVRRGNSYRDALRQWESIANIPGVNRLSAILQLADQGADLGRLVADEAQLGRDERHRELLAAVERKGQQVWIPVTVAALVPGCMLLAVPFVRALSFFSN